MKKFLIISTLLTLPSYLACADNHGDSKVEATKSNQLLLNLSIADPKVQRIPIKDNGEKLVNLVDITNPRLKFMGDFPDSQADNTLIYKTKKGTHTKVRESVAKKIEAMLQYLPSDVGIAYGSGYSTAKEAKEVLDNDLDKFFQQVKNKDEAFNLVSKNNRFFFADKNAFNARHTGAVVSLTLFKGDKLMDLGDMKTNNKAATEEIAKNRALLLEAANKAGLIGHSDNWWRFSYGSRAWAYLTGTPNALYDLVDPADRAIVEMSKEEIIAANDWEDGDVRMSEEAKEKIFTLDMNDERVLNIPIKDNGEPLVDIRDKKNPRIKNITDFKNSSIYAHPILPHDLVQAKKGLYAKVRKGTYERLEKMLDYLPKNIGIAFAFGYHTTDRLYQKFNYLMLMNYNTYLDKNIAYEHSIKFIPFVMSKAAVVTGGMTFISLFDTTNNQVLNLGVVGSRPGNLNLEHFARATSAEQRQYRKLLTEAAVKAGFIGYSQRWDAFSYGDIVWAYVTGAPNAIYGPVSEEDKKFKSLTKEEYLKQFDPAAIEKNLEK
jgi:D-alanyl-D-alanine dipeptidase